jgi:hypothetical protein
VNLGEERRRGGFDPEEIAVSAGIEKALVGFLCLLPDTEGNAQAIGQELRAGFGFDLAENPGDEIDEDRVAA